MNRPPRQHSRRITLCLLMAAVLLLSGCGWTARPANGAGSMAACIDAEGLTLCRLDDGSAERLISGRHLSSPVFSPDGRCLYYKNSSDVFCVSLNGGRPLLAAANADYVGDYDGRAVFLSQTDGVTLYDPASHASEQMIPQPETGFIGTVSFSPDRLRTVYTICETDAGQTRLVSVCITVPGASEPDVYPASQYPAGVTLRALAWAPESSVCYMAAGASGAETLKLYALSPVDGVMTPVGASIPASAEVSISGDGHILLSSGYASDADRYESLLQVDLSTGKPTYLPGGYAPLAGLAASWDGSAAAYALNGSEPATQGIFIRTNEVNSSDSTGKSAKTLLISGGLCACPVFSRDGQTLYFLDTAGETFSLCRAPANSAGKETLFTGIAAPDGVFCQTSRAAFCLYDTTASPSEKQAKSTGK